MEYEQLKLDSQLCFPVYAASRLITREYQPYLDALNITYTQYLVLMVLWETDSVPVNDIARRLILNTNTITPLLKRMESQGLIKRQRSEHDERKVMVKLSAKGAGMKKQAAKIPAILAGGLLSDSVSMEDLVRLKSGLQMLVNSLTERERQGEK